MTAADSSQFKRFIAGLDQFSVTVNEFQRTDVAPKESLGNGPLHAADQQQLNNYIAAIDAPTTGDARPGPQQGPSLKWSRQNFPTKALGAASGSSPPPPAALRSLLLDPLTSFTAGTRRLVEFRFDIVPDAHLGPTSLFFTDDAIARCTTDILAGELHAIFEDGQIEITPARADEISWISTITAVWPSG
ncbi:MAG TPA: hypothetical protein VNA17_10395 [Pyrinomonadaceae bacterium]|nr:hypothetical protein [Pyrinomonadaceae bacterium]